MTSSNLILKSFFFSWEFNQRTGISLVIIQKKNLTGSSKSGSVSKVFKCENKKTPFSIEV